MASILRFDFLSYMEPTEMLKIALCCRECYIYIDCNRGKIVDTDRRMNIKYNKFIKNKIIKENRKYHRYSNKMLRPVLEANLSTHFSMIFQLHCPSCRCEKNGTKEQCVSEKCFMKSYDFDGYMYLLKDAIQIQQLDVIENMIQELPPRKYKDMRVLWEEKGSLDIEELWRQGKITFNTVPVQKANTGHGGTVEFLWHQDGKFKLHYNGKV